MPARRTKEKENIEAELGHPVMWDPNPDRADKIILSARSADLAERERWPEYPEWLVSEIVLFRKVFRERVRVMDVSWPEALGEEDTQGKNGS